MSKTALVMAGGTGGHIFPGLALAQGLRERDWRVHWLGGVGTPGQPSMESRLVPAQGFPFEAVDFSGVRGKGWLTLVQLPWHLLRACWQSLAVLRRVKPDVVLGLGGYITLPAGLVCVLLGKPLLLHEQNSVAGLANKLLVSLAARVWASMIFAPSACVLASSLPMATIRSPRIPTSARVVSPAVTSRPPRMMVSSFMSCPRSCRRSHPRGCPFSTAGLRIVKP